MQKILIAGAAGAIGQKLAEQLLSEGHEVSGLVRTAEQKEALDNQGIHTHLIEGLLPSETLTLAVKGQDAVVFAAGSKGKALEVVDRDGAIHLANVAMQVGVKRFILLSSIYAGRPDEGPDSLRAYFHAKHAADVYLEQLALDYTIVRPGMLHDERATGKIQIGQAFNGPSAKISRYDVAKTLAAALKEPHTIGKTFEMIEGNMDIHTALQQLD